MSNMSYCRFRNTLQDLRDCQENFSDLDSHSKDEISARKSLYKVCCQIAQDYEDYDLDTELLDRDEDDD